MPGDIVSARCSPPDAGYQPAGRTDWKSMFLRRPSAPAKFSRESRSVYQERPWRIFEPGIRQHKRPRRIGLFALIEPAHLTTPFLVLRKGVGDMHLRPDPRQREKSGSG